MILKPSDHWLVNQIILCDTSNQTKTAEESFGTFFLEKEFSKTLNEIFVNQIQFLHNRSRIQDPHQKKNINPKSIG